MSKSQSGTAAFRKEIVSKSLIKLRKRKEQMSVSPGPGAYEHPESSLELLQNKIEIKVSKRDYQQKLKSKMTALNRE